MRPDKAKIKGISQIMCERTLFLVKAWSQILKLSIGNEKIALALLQKVRFRSENNQSQKQNISSPLFKGITLVYVRNYFLDYRGVCWLCKGLE